ncbi:Protein timeless [Amphibalanus amphitrite]|uniref:Protein timeless n=1 Tax=Amphibalanus amphitrite TaxID=1232801 RepID=A0A6A4W6L8_AMPAM|nr:Protein timeless [Amphibalanus amphitrite]
MGDVLAVRERVPGSDGDTWGAVVVCRGRSAHRDPPGPDVTMVKMSTAPSVRRVGRKRLHHPSVMVDWAPSHRASLMQQLSVLSAAALHDETAYRRSAAVLKTLVQKLRHDDTVTYTYRRQLLHANIIRTNLVPLLLHKEPPFQVQDLTLTLLDMLSSPEESLRPSQTALSGLSPEVSIQLSLGLRGLKEELSSPMAARAVLAPLGAVLARQTTAAAMRGRDAECITTTLSLLRNLLHGPLCSDAAEMARYRNLLWALLSADLGQALHQLMQSPSLSAWCVPVVELLAQLYKMYASGHLHKTLQNWLNPTPSDSSEDDESNTSPPSLKRKLTTVRTQERQGEPNLSTSSSDEGRCVKRSAKAGHFKPHHRSPKSKPSLTPPSSGACASDGGPAPPTPQQTPPPPPPPPPKPPQEPGARLLRSIRARAHKILSLVTREPSQGDLDIVLVEFTIQFLLAGWGPLVKALMSSLPDKMDKSHLYWAIVYFMKPCTELRVSYPNIQYVQTVRRARGPVLCSELLMLLTYEATRLVAIGSSQPTSTLERFHSQRQLHMLTNAIREILYGMEAIRGYSSDEHIAQIQNTLCQVGRLRQFRQLFLLLIGQCRLGPASLPYLRDLVLTNHLLISMQETFNNQFPLLSHVTLFAEPTIIRRYTSLLKLYATNAPVLNDALFTVLHHVVGDANRIELLFQPDVLKTFSKIIGSDLPLLQDWLDLIEYTIQRFIERQHDPAVRAALQQAASDELTGTLGSPGSPSDPPVGQSVHQLAPSAGGRADVFATICGQLQAEFGEAVSPRWALQKLSELQLLAPGQCRELAALLGVDSDQLSDPSRPGRDADLSDPAACRQVLDHPSVEFLLDCVRRDAELGSESLSWLQSELLEVCAARLSAAAPPPEPVALFSQRLGRACPLVPLTRRQIHAVNAPFFVKLLRALRVQAPTIDYVYPSIPVSLPSPYLFAVAQKVAPLDEASLKFDPADLTRPASTTEPVSSQAAEMTDVTSDLLPPPPPPPPPPPRPVTPIRYGAVEIECVRSGDGALVVWQYFKFGVSISDCLVMS